MTDIAYSLLTPEEREVLIKSKDTIQYNKQMRQMEEKAEREKAIEEKQSQDIGSYMNELILEVKQTALNDA